MLFVPEHSSDSVKKFHCTSSRLSSFKSSGQTVYVKIHIVADTDFFNGLRYVPRGKTNVRFGSIRFSLVESDNRLPNNFIVLRRRRCCHRTVYSNPNHFSALCRHQAQSFHYMLSQNAFSIYHFFERGDHVKLNQQMLRNAGPMDVVCTGAFL